MPKPPPDWPGWWTDDLALLLLRQWDPMCLAAHNVPEDEYGHEAAEIAEVLRAGGNVGDVRTAMSRIIDRNATSAAIDEERDERAAKAIVDWYSSRTA